MLTKRLRFLLYSMAVTITLFVWAIACVPLLRGDHSRAVYIGALCTSLPYWAAVFVPNLVLGSVSKYAVFSSLPRTVVPYPLPPMQGAGSMGAQLLGNVCVTLLAGVIYGLIGFDVMRATTRWRHGRSIMAAAGCFAYIATCVQISRLDMYPKSGLWHNVAEILAAPADAVLVKLRGTGFSWLPPEPAGMLLWIDDCVLHGLITLAIAFAVLSALDAVRRLLSRRRVVRIGGSRSQ
jgi:hypothetical protein